MRATLSSWRETNAIPDDMDMMTRKDVRYYMAYLHARRGVILFSINVVLLVIFYMWLLYGLVVELAGIQEMVAPLMLMQSIALVVFCVLHSMAVLGWKCALVFFIITLVISTVVEMIGVHTGVIFGQYQYTSLIGAKLLDVPVEVPFSWFMMLYPSFCVADLIIEGQAHSRRPKSRWLSLITISTCTAFVVTGWDLAADPLGSTDSGIWVWTHDNGFYFGVPLLNFVGWFCTSTVIVALYLTAEFYMSKKRLQIAVTPPLASLPLLAFFGMIVFYATISQPSELCLVAVFTMGFPWLLAVIRLMHSSVRTQLVDFSRDYTEY